MKTNLKLMFTSGRVRFAGCLLLSAFLTACGDDEEKDEGSELVPHALMHEAAETYQKIALASYQDSLTTARELDQALRDFVDEPSAQSLTLAREAWLAAREPYLQTEVFRFYQGPIDNEETGVEGLLNAWPLDESYIDYVKDDQGDEGEIMSGIVNDPELEISSEALAGLNEQGGEEHIATGYHAIEFLLWGQDLSEDGPGDRPFTDYVSGEDGTHENQDRRGQYLLTASELLLENLETVVSAWEENEDNYRAEFEEAEPAEQLRRILTGMIILSGFETGGERLQTALDNGEQEDEHSCFSDNTHRDMVQDIRGVLNVYNGRYVAIDGSVVEGESLQEVVRYRDPTLAEEVEAHMLRSLALAEELQVPFDLEISPENPAGNARVEALIESLQAQEQLLQDVFRGFGLAIPKNPT
jgi:putative iron-regulated protein